jgi:hypothetical protein
VASLLGGQLIPPKSEAAPPWARPVPGTDRQEGRRRYEVELRACKTVKKDDKELITEIAKLTKRDTIGYDDYYGPGPHGPQYIAKPDGTVTEGKTYPPFKGTLGDKILDPDNARGRK